MSAGEAADAKIPTTHFFPTSWCPDLHNLHGTFSCCKMDITTGHKNLLVPGNEVPGSRWELVENWYWNSKHNLKTHVNFVKILFRSLRPWRTKKVG